MVATTPTSSRTWSPMQQKFAMNKALEQKLIGPMEESHTKQQSPKHFCEWSFEQGDRKWQQDELEHGFELW